MDRGGRRLAKEGEDEGKGRKEEDGEGRKGKEGGG